MVCERTRAPESGLFSGSGKEKRSANKSFFMNNGTDPGVFLFEKSACREPPASFDLSRKELDGETGFYYYGARYLNPRTSMWISADPAVGDYAPRAPADDEARKHNGNLPGMGGVFNHVNFHVYHYAGNNPIKYIDPDGNFLHIIIGTVIGAGALTSAITQDLNSLARGEGIQIDPTRVLIATGAGALSGALASTGSGLIGHVIGNAAIGGSANITEQVVEEGDFSKVDWFKVGGSVLAGAVAGKLGGAGANSNGHLSSMANQLGKRLQNAVTHKSGEARIQEMAKAFSCYFKQTGTIEKEMIKGIIRSNIPSAVIGGKEAVENLLNRINEELDSE
jgi:RHS repeat-associated protein